MRLDPTIVYAGLTILNGLLVVALGFGIARHNGPDSARALFIAAAIPFLFFAAHFLVAMAITPALRASGLDIALQTTLRLLAPIAILVVGLCLIPRELLSDTGVLRLPEWSIVPLMLGIALGLLAAGVALAYATNTMPLLGLNLPAVLAHILISIPLNYGVVWALMRQAIDPKGSGMPWRTILLFAVLISLPIGLIAQLLLPTYLTQALRSLPPLFAALLAIGLGYLRAQSRSAWSVAPPFAFVMTVPMLVLALVWGSDR